MQTLTILWSYLQLKDVIDVLVVSFLVYQLLLIIKGTRAAQMLFGIGALLALFWLAVSLRLYALNWILSHFFDSFFIILVILFQDQIRSALARFGAGRQLFRFGMKARAADMVDLEEVIEACEACSKEHVGSLIILEKDQGLMNFISTGTRLDSDIHSDILYALFQSRSPLHDGAVILSQGKIAAAGCFLPLSKNIEIERHMGTRHRAAIGLSEVTDAIAIVVSEETGRVSVAHDGEMIVCVDSSELRRTIEGLIGTDDTLANPSLLGKKS